MITSQNKPNIMNSICQISKREHEVLNLIAYEYSTKQIAEKLFIAYETANSHRKSLLRKLDVSNTAGLVRIGCETGLVKLAYRTAI